MIRLTLFLSLFLLIQHSYGQVDLMEKEKLNQLLEERKTKFSSYFNSIEKKSGIFGNKTKKDIQESNEVLIDIVKTDNNIISVLNRALDFKSYEKTTFNYDKLASDEKINALANENKALAAKIESLNQAVERSGKQSLLYKSLFYVTVVAAGLVIYILRRRRAI